MATYSSPQVTTAAPVPSYGHFQAVKVLRFPLTITAALTTADIFAFGNVPPGFRLSAATLVASDMDTNGSPTLAINVGDAGSGTRLFSASTVGQAGTSSTALAVVVTSLWLSLWIEIPAARLVIQLIPQTLTPK